MKRNLVVLDPAGVRQTAFEAPRLTVGRDSTNDVVLDDPQTSRFHAALEVRGDATWVFDLGSRNGILLNGTLVQGRAMLANRDLLIIGLTQMRFTEKAEAWRDSQLKIVT